MASSESAKFSCCSSASTKSPGGYSSFVARLLLTVMCLHRYRSVLTNIALRTSKLLTCLLFNNGFFGMPYRYQPLFARYTAESIPIRLGDDCELTPGLMDFTLADRHAARWTWPHAMQEQPRRSYHSKALVPLLPSSFLRFLSLELTATACILDFHVGVAEVPRPLPIGYRKATSQNSLSESKT